jgi:hypothetical protein
VRTDFLKVTGGFKFNVQSLIYCLPTGCSAGIIAIAIDSANLFAERRKSKEAGKQFRFPASLPSFNVKT